MDVVREPSTMVHDRIPAEVLPSWARGGENATIPPILEKKTTGTVGTINVIGK